MVPAASQVVFEVVDEQANRPLPDTGTGGDVQAIEGLDASSELVAQYQILFDVILNLNDAVVKGILTILVVYGGVIAFTLDAVSKRIGTAVDLLYLNYGLILFFLYYLFYLRFRIRTMFQMADEIERMAPRMLRSIQEYEDRTNRRFLSTTGTFVFLFLVLLFFNTLLVWRLA